MNCDNAIQFYAREIAAHARSMPLDKAREFLYGALSAAGEHPGVEHVRTAYRSLSEADNQLELISTGQLKLDLEGAQ